MVCEPEKWVMQFSGKFWSTYEWIVELCSSKLNWTCLSFICFLPHWKLGFMPPFLTFYHYVPFFCVLMGFHAYSPLIRWILMEKDKQINEIQNHDTSRFLRSFQSRQNRLEWFSQITPTSPTQYPSCVPKSY